MTDAEIIERLAKWMGWTRQACLSGLGTEEWCSSDGRFVLFCDQWYPPESLDDCRVVEDEIKRRGMSSIYRDHIVAMGHDTLTDLIYLTARQRCEAMLRTICNNGTGIHS